MYICFYVDLHICTHTVMCKLIIVLTLEIVSRFLRWPSESRANSKDKCEKPSA